MRVLFDLVNDQVYIRIGSGPKVGLGGFMLDQVGVFGLRVGLDCIWVCNWIIKTKGPFAL